MYDSDTEIQIFNDIGSTDSITYSFITDGYTGTGNFYDMIFSFISGYYHSTNLCVDKGDPLTYPDFISEEILIELQSRTVHTSGDLDSNEQLDLGYHYLP